MPYSDNKKYQALIKIARELFFRHGTHRITIEEICRKANVSKMTFYKFFSNKDEIVLRVMDEWFAEGIAEFDHIREQDISFSEKLDALIRLKFDKTGEYSDTFFNEIMDSEGPLKSYLIDISQKNRELSLKFYKEGQKEGAIREDINIEFLLLLNEFFINMFNNKNMQRLLPDTHQRYEELLKFFLYGMLVKSESSPGSKKGA